MKIGKRIKEIRISQGLTQDELSEKSGIAVRTIQRIENNQVTPSIYSIKAIGAALDVDLNEIVVDSKDTKFEIKLVISNFSNLIVDIKTLINRNWKILLALFVSVVIALFYEDSKLFLIDIFDNTSISISTINCGSENECDIEVVKKNENGSIIWKRVIGGTSYDKAGQVIRTKDGDYIVVGSTSSYGKGNYDVFIIKVSSEGEILWQKTYGEFLNDYGLRIAAIDNNLYQIEGTRQICKTVNVSNDCYDQEWLFRIDESGLVQ
jgi:transcriptional regulator with XRE-family HTH domain